MNAKALDGRCTLRSSCGHLHPLGLAAAQDEDADLSATLAAAKKRVTDRIASVALQVHRGRDESSWKVRHLGTTEATVQGNTQTSKSRSISTKQWKVKDVDAEGNATFVHSVAECRHVAEGLGAAGGALQQRRRTRHRLASTCRWRRPSAFRLPPSRSLPPARCWNATRLRSRRIPDWARLSCRLPVEPVKIGQELARLERDPRPRERWPRQADQDAHWSIDLSR